MFKNKLKADLSTIPRFFETDDLGINKREKIIHLHFYNDATNWYIIESNGNDTFYGIVISDQYQNKSEWRDISIHELEMYDQNLAAIKCDPDWVPMKAQDIDIIKKANNWT